MRYAGRHYYIIPDFTKEELDTLLWLADHGYDADFYRSCYIPSTRLPNGKDGVQEHQAWAMRDAFDADPHSFLSCSGSKTLNEKLLAFLEAIV